MKKKKFERQQRKKQQREDQKKQDFYNNMKTVILTPLDNSPIRYERLYTWSCPNHNGSFTYSMKINERWGHPTDLAFCAVSCTYHKIEFKDEAKAI